MTTLLTALVDARSGIPSRLAATLADVGRLSAATVIVVGDDAPNAASAPSWQDAVASVGTPWVALFRAGDRIFPAYLDAIEGNADSDIAYTHSLRLDAAGGVGSNLHFRPAWSPELQLGAPSFLGWGASIRSDVVRAGVGITQGMGEATAYDLALRATEWTARASLIPVIGWAELPDRSSNGERARFERVLTDALRRRGASARVERTPGGFRARRNGGDELTSIIIPTRDRVDLLRPCLETVRANTPRSHEVLIIDNDSRDPETLEFLSSCPERVLRFPGRFDFSAMNNAAAIEARGQVLVFLNNDTRVLDSDWLPGLAEPLSEPSIGVVGAKLLHPEGTLQHVGITLHRGARADHLCSGRRELEISHPYFPRLACEVAAVTAACLAIRKETFSRLGGFDPRLPVAYNDVDLCLRLRRRGYRVLFSPFARVEHRECASRERRPPLADDLLFRSRWTGTDLDGDLYLGPVAKELGMKFSFPGGVFSREEISSGGGD